ncbi:MAG: peptide-methionine (S)-S-oxide reductase MsrA, partial [Coriobacteriales bacterium]|nr:peptide-methionine (S)-S-oxide reductase MsrA [Coriobacteriales bacterium]
MQERDIYLAGGCFWGVEKYLSLVPGVLNTRAGYANSKIPNPSYQQVCSGDSGAVETVHCLYDQAVLRLDELLFMYFDIIDPTSIDRQANDIGSQYRTGIYYTEASDADVVQACLFELAIRYQQPIVVENQMLGSFYAAEDYHQSYLDKNPQGYCHLPIDMFL